MAGGVDIWDEVVRRTGKVVRLYGFLFGEWEFSHGEFWVGDDPS